MIAKIKDELKNNSSPQRAKASAWYFKTGKGQYGFGDKFIGVSTPLQRQIAKKYLDLDLEDLKILLHSPVHEERLTGLFILVLKFQKADKLGKEMLFKFYLQNLRGVNNWDLVDSSAHKIIGEFIKDKKITLLLSFAKSPNIWERRIAIISTFAFLAEGNSKPTYAVSDLLLEDSEDLIQKAVGWTLREAGKRVSEKELKAYIRNNYKKMGRTTLRYAIERFPKNERLEFLNLGKSGEK